MFSFDNLSGFGQ